MRAKVLDSIYLSDASTSPRGSADTGGNTGRKETNLLGAANNGAESRDSRDFEPAAAYGDDAPSNRESLARPPPWTSADGEMKGETARLSIARTLLALDLLSNYARQGRILERSVSRFV